MVLLTDVNQIILWWGVRDKTSQDNNLHTLLFFEMNMLLLCRNIKVIHFYDLNNLKEMVHSCSVTPHLPGRLCTSSSSTLLYLDYSQKPCQVRCLDCSTCTPKPGKTITHVPQQSGIYMIYAASPVTTSSYSTSPMVTRDCSPTTQELIKPIGTSQAMYQG